MKIHAASLLLCFASVVPVLAQQYNGITLIINNESDYPDDQVWLQWTNQGPGNGTAQGLHGISGGISILPSDQNLGNPGAGTNPNGYLVSNLAPLAGGKPHRYVINNFMMDGGRINVTLGSAGIAYSNSYTPPPNNFNDPNNNFTKRYDKLEAFMQGSTTDDIDMTAVDFFSIPFEVDAYDTPSPDPDSTTPVQSLASSNGSEIIKALSAIAANPSAPAPNLPKGVTRDLLPQISSDSPYLVINTLSRGLWSGAPIPYSPVGSEANPSSNFVRVIGNDQSMTNVFYQNSPNIDPIPGVNGTSPGQAAIPANYLYKPFNNYLSYLDGTNTTTHQHYTGTTTIAGTFDGVGAPGGTDKLAAQTYSLTTSFFPNSTMTFNNQSYKGYVTLTGTTTLTNGPNEGQKRNITLRIPYQFMLAPTGIVGANAGYEISYGAGSAPAQDVIAPDNDVWTWIEGDFFAGMNIGAVGSTVSFTGTVNGQSYTNKPVGQMRSQDWFYIGQFLADKARKGEKVWKYYFDYLQSNSDYYNTWGQALYPLTDAYNFAYSDRVQGGNVAISWDATGRQPVQAVMITILPDVSSQVGTTGGGENSGGNGKGCRPLRHNGGFPARGFGTPWRSFFP